MTSLQFIGMKHTGKSTLGRLWAQRTGMSFYDLDTLLEAEHPAPPKTAREIYREFGAETFQRYETQAARKIAPTLALGQTILAWGGGTIMNPLAVEALQKQGQIILLEESAEILYERIRRGGLPAFLSADHPWQDFQVLYQERTERMRRICHHRLSLENAGIPQALEALAALIQGDSYARQ